MLWSTPHLGTPPNDSNPDPSAAKIVNLDSSSGTPFLDVLNTSTKPISVMVIEYAATASRPRSVSWQIFNSPILPGSTGAVQTPAGMTFDRLASQARVAAIIYSDRTHTGHVTNPATNNDAIFDIFQERQGEADAFASWQKTLSTLPGDPSAFMQALTTKVNPMADLSETAAFSYYSSGTHIIDAGMRAVTKRTLADIARGQHYSIGAADPFNGVHDNASAQQAILSWVDARATASKIESTDAGEARR